VIPDFMTQALAPERWPTFALVTARLAGLMLAAPLWSLTVLPRLARAAITALLALVLLPNVPATPLPERLLDLPLPIAMELVIGIAIGLTAAVLVHGVALGGEVLAIQMGLSLGPALAPTPDVQATGVGQIENWLALSIYLAIGGHLFLLRGVAESLQALPPGAAIDYAAGARHAVDLFTILFSSAARAAAPVMATLLLTHLALAILTRAVPQLNTMLVSLPLTFGVGMLMIGVTLPILSSVIGGWMEALPDRVATAVEHFRPLP
jgi:flagellar biosynthetic protein FliR